VKVFVVSQLSSSTASHQLICQLARIQHEHRKTVPVLVIDDLHDNGVSGIVANRIAQHMDKVESDWVLIDFGQHDSATCMDFIQKIARYNYLSARLRKRILVIMVPAMHLGIYSRTLNASFNNLPASTTASVRSVQIGRLLMVTRLERVLMSIPRLAGVLRRMRRVALRVFRRVPRSH
jgi:hypothetical protein